MLMLLMFWAFSDSALKSFAFIRSAGTLMPGGVSLRI